MCRLPHRPATLFDICRFQGGPLTSVCLNDMFNWLWCELRSSGSRLKHNYGFWNRVTPCCMAFVPASCMWNGVLGLLKLEFDSAGGGQGVDMVCGRDFCQCREKERLDRRSERWSVRCPTCCRLGNRRGGGGGVYPPRKLWT